MAKKPIKLGLVGQPSSGKDTAAAHLIAAYGFVDVNTADLLRFYIAEHQLGEPTRDLLQVVANVLRAEHGADYLVRLALQNPASRLVISALRNPAEVKLLKDQGAPIVCLTASIETRYRRARDRGRVGDHITYEIFKQQEEAEDTSSNPNAQIVSEVVAMADYSLANDGTVDQLTRALDTLMLKLFNLKPNR